MKKTFTCRISHYGYIDGNLTEWHNLIDSFAGQEVTITVETMEPEKPKVKMCQSFFEDRGCDRPAQWEIVDDGHKHYRCNEHVWRILHGFQKRYTITPISPQPPELPKPVVVEWEDDLRLGYHAVIRIPEELRNKCFTVRF